MLQKADETITQQDVDKKAMRCVEYFLRTTENFDGSATEIIEKYKLVAIERNINTELLRVRMKIKKEEACHIKAEE